MNLSALKVIIPFAFLVIIIECLAKLGYDNRQLKTDNQYLQKESRELTNKNNGLANTLQNLTEAVTSMNTLVDKEAKAPCSSRDEITAPQRGGEKCSQRPRLHQ